MNSNNINFDNEYSNVPSSIIEKMEYNLIKIPNHPLSIIKNKIYDYFKTKRNDWNIFEDLSKVVSVEDNFDKLLIPKTHVSRSKSDTYYVNETTVLRTHTTCHQSQLLEQNYNNFLICGDVYRRDEIDRSHYNIFHQLEGVILYDINDNIDLEKELKDLMTGLCEYLFPSCEYRVNSDYFPFTNPSFEIEVKFMDKWIEILGCGIIQNSILENANRNDKKGIAWGLGLERLAMVLFDIPDIRYFWIKDEKFLKQFKENTITKFKPFSKLNPISRDLCVYVNENIDDKENWLKTNDFFEIIRDLTNGWICEVIHINTFKLESVYSLCFRVSYSPKDYTINNPAKFKDIVKENHDNLLVELKKLSWINKIC